MAAAMNPPTNANSARMTISTAAQRRMPWRLSQTTTGSSPAAMKNASPIRISTELARRNSSTRPMVTATPAAPIIPTMKGERAFSGLPGFPSPPARRSASASSMASRTGWSGLTSSRSGEVGGTCSAAAWVFLIVG